MGMLLGLSLMIVGFILIFKQGWISGTNQLKNKKNQKSKTKKNKKIEKLQSNFLKIAGVIFILVGIYLFWYEFSLATCSTEIEWTFPFPKCKTFL